MWLDPKLSNTKGLFVICIALDGFGIYIAIDGKPVLIVDVQTATSFS